MDAAKNVAKGTVSTGYNSTAIEILLTTGDGARFAEPPFNAVWWNATDYPDPSDDPDVEIVRVHAIVAGDTLGIIRAQEATTATNKNIAGKTYKLLAGLTAKFLNDLQALDVGDGTFTVLTQEAAPTSPAVAPGAAGTNLLEAGDYQWKLVYKCGDAHTEAGAASQVLTINPATQLPPVINLPLGYSNFVTAIDLYRTNVNDSVFFVSALDLALTDFPYSDNLPDASQSGSEPTTNDTANPKLVVIPTSTNIGRIVEDYLSGVHINNVNIDCDLGDHAFRAGDTSGSISNFYMELLGIGGFSVGDASGDNNVSFDMSPLLGAVRLHALNGVEIAAPATSTSGILGNGEVSFYLDESLNFLKVAVKYSDGTEKTASIALT